MVRGSWQAGDDDKGCPAPKYLHHNGFHTVRRGYKIHEEEIRTKKSTRKTIEKNKRKKIFEQATTSISIQSLSYTQITVQPNIHSPPHCLK